MREENNLRLDGLLAGSNQLWKAKVRAISKIMLGLIAVTFAVGLVVLASTDSGERTVYGGVRVHYPSFTGSVKVSRLMGRYEAVFSGEVDVSRASGIESYIHRSDDGNVQVLELFATYTQKGIEEVRSEMLSRIDDSVDSFARHEEPSGDSRSYVDENRQISSVKFSYKGVDCLILQKNEAWFLTMIAEGPDSRGFIDSFGKSQ